MKEGPKIIVNDLSLLTRWFFSCFTKIRAITNLSRRSLLWNQVVFDVTGQVRQENGFKEELATHIVRKHPALSGDLDWLCWWLCLVCVCDRHLAGDTNLAQLFLELLHVPRFCIPSSPDVFYIYIYIYYILVYHISMLCINWDQSCKISMDPP